MMRKTVVLIIVCLLTAESAAIAGQIRQELSARIERIEIDDDLNIHDFGNDLNLGEGGKSKWKALGFSLLLPGAGQYYTRNDKKALFFGGAEVLVWSGFFGLRTYGRWKKEDYKAWAAFHAGADINGKSESYFEKLTYYDNLDEYNQLELVYEGSRAEIFPSTPGYYWNWDSDQSRGHYRDLRNISKNAFRRSLLVAGAAVINRLLSGIDAYRSAGAFNRGLEFSDTGWKIYYSDPGFTGDGEVEIGLSLNF